MNALQQMLWVGRHRRKIYRLDGQPVTIKALAAELGVTDMAIHGHMKRKGCGLKEAVAYFRARRYAREQEAAEAKAVEDIMNILNEGGNGE